MTGFRVPYHSQRSTPEKGRCTSQRSGRVELALLCRTHKVSSNPARALAWILLKIIALGKAEVLGHYSLTPFNHWVWASLGNKGHWVWGSLPLRQRLKELTAGGWFLTTLSPGRQYVLPSREIWMTYLPPPHIYIYLLPLSSTKGLEYKKLNLEKYQSVQTSKHRCQDIFLLNFHSFFFS